MSDVLTVDERTFQDEVDAFAGVAVVDFFADWCAPCRALEPVVERLAREHPDVRVARVDVDGAPRLAARYGVRSLPTVVRLDHGDPVAMAIGAVPYDVLTDTLGIGGADGRPAAA